MTLKEALVKAGAVSPATAATVGLNIVSLRERRDAIIRAAIGLPTLPLHKGIKWECGERVELMAINKAIKAIKELPSK